MIETVEGYENLDAILDVPEVDGAFLGPNDLAISHSGSTEGAGASPRDLEMIEADRGCLRGAETSRQAPSPGEARMRIAGRSSDTRSSGSARTRPCSRRG